MELLVVALVYLLVGALAGVVAGLFGVGGGLIIVPALSYVFLKFHISSMQLAVGTSLAVIVVTATSSLLAHNKYGAVQWPVFRIMAPYIVAGSLLGAYAAARLQSGHLKTVFGVVEILIALQMYYELKPKAKQQLPGRFIIAVVSSIIGFVSALAGIGGGTMTVPFLSWCNVAIHKAVATSAACGLPISIAGTLGFIFLLPSNAQLPDHSFGFVYWPAFIGIAVASSFTAPMGARLAHRLPTKKLRQFFAIFLLLIGLTMLNA